MARDNENTHLKELGKSSFRVAEGESDIRGWVVKNMDGRVVGVVDDLVIDDEAEKVKYVVVDLTNNELQLRDRKVLLPIDLARLDVAFKNVIYPAPMANELASIPSHEKGRFYYQTEGLISNAFAPYYHPKQQTGSDEVEGTVTPHSEERTRVIPVPPPPPTFTGERTATQQSQPIGFANEGPQGTTGGMGGGTHEAYGTSRPDDDRSTESRMEIPQDSSAGSRQQGEMERPDRPQTVVGVFEHTNQAQAAVEYLVKEGIKRENIDIVLRDADDYDTSRKGEEHHTSMSEFFSNLFGGDTRAKDYSDAASMCSVVTVHADSLPTAEKVAEVLDMHGAVNVEDRYKREGRADNTAVVHTKRYQSLIIEYPEEGRVRGLR